jgi:hypothetical protein
MSFELSLQSHFCELFDHSTQDAIFSKQGLALIQALDDISLYSGFSAIAAGGGR